MLTGAAHAGTILVVGDSLSAAYGMEVRSGWVALLQQRLDEQQLPHKVVNASISGDTTAGGAARLPKLLSQHRPNIVVVQLGGNDGLRGLPLEQVKKNLTNLVTISKASGAQVLLVGIRLPPNYGTPYNERFRRVYTDVAAAQRVPLVPFLLEGLSPNGVHVQEDGLHPTAKAQPQMLDNVWGKLKTLL